MSMGDRHDRFMAAIYRAHVDYAAEDIPMPEVLQNWYFQKKSQFSGDDPDERGDNVVREYDLGLRLWEYDAGVRLWQKSSDIGHSASTATSHDSETRGNLDLARPGNAPIAGQSTGVAPRKYPPVVVSMFALTAEYQREGDGD